VFTVIFCGKYNVQAADTVYCLQLMSSARMEKLLSEKLKYFVLVVIVFGRVQTETDRY